jgi:hypothetical protein
MTQLPLPFGDAKWNLPQYFRSWGHLEAMLEKHHGGQQRWPSGHWPVHGLARGRFLLMTARPSPDIVEWIVGYYRPGMTWVPVGSFSSYAEGMWFRKQWATLSRTALRKAVWMLLHRPAVPAMSIPTEAAVWDEYDDNVQAEVWRLIQAGTPGRITEVIMAGRACGLY